MALNMWGYLAAYKMPHDDPGRLEARVRIDYPVDIDRVLGFGLTPTQRLQHRFAQQDSINRFERVLVWCHWMWFVVPHASVGYVLLRDPDRFPSAAVRMYAVFDLGAVFYWAIPTAPPWWAAEHGRMADRRVPRVRRMMIEYGEQFWGDRWEALYDVLGGNPLAAMPSLHFATSLMAAHLLCEVGPVAGAVGWTYAGMLGSGARLSGRALRGRSDRRRCAGGDRAHHSTPGRAAGQAPVIDAASGRGASG